MHISSSKPALILSSKSSQISFRLGVKYSIPVPASKYSIYKYKSTLCSATSTSTVLLL